MSILDWLIGSAIATAAFYLFGYFKGKNNSKPPTYKPPKKSDITITKKERENLHNEIQNDSANNIAAHFNDRYPNSKRNHKD